MCAAARPFVWPVHDAAPVHAVIRAVLLAALGACAVVGAVSVVAWRRRLTLLASARRLDEALGLAEVIASGYAFERDGRDDQMASFAVDRARRSLDHVDLDRVVVPSRRVRSTKESRWLAGAIVAAIVGLAFGGIDRLVIYRTIHPLTQRESAAASELRKAAEQAAANAPRGPNEEKHPQAEAVVEAARRASEAAQRGDRKRAQDALEDMRKAARALEADERNQARSLRSLRDELEGKSAGRGRGDDPSKEPSAGTSRSGAPSVTAFEALEKLKKELDSAGGDKEAIRKMIECLERAEAAARAASAEAKSGGKDASAKDASSKDAGKGASGKAGAREARAEAWSRSAKALEEAREALARGDKEAAKRAMERAESELASLEKAGSDPSRSRAMARLADEASELDRSMHAAMSGDRSSEGREGREGDGKDGSAKAREGSGPSKTVSSDKGDPSGSPRAGSGGSDRGAGPEQRRVKVNGDLQARTDVREGERAVSAIEGMGKGGDPRAYREIFPSYDTVVEDGLRDDAVPAARRPTVRRYFSSIRPGGDEDESRKP
jgi:hypothetical protein